MKNHFLLTGKNKNIININSKYIESEDIYIYIYIYIYISYILRIRMTGKSHLKTI